MKASQQRSSVERKLKHDICTGISSKYNGSWDHNQLPDVWFWHSDLVYGGKVAQAMTMEDLKKIIDAAAEAGAMKALRKLKDADRITYVFTDSFKKTEELLYLYPKLPADHPEKLRIDKALEKIQNDDYKDVIASRYFDGLTISEISEIYDCKYQNISKKRNKLVRILAAELFPEDVLKEILER